MAYPVNTVDLNLTNEYTGIIKVIVSDNIYNNEYIISLLFKIIFHLNTNEYC